MAGWLDKYNDGGRLPDRKERLMRQAFAESSWREGNIRSRAGALGPLQIMPQLYEDYVKATGDKTPFEKVKDFEHAIKVRNWKLDDAANAEYIKNRPNSPEVRLAKQYLEYNYGRTALINHLNKAKEKGLDIYKKLEWIEDLPKEPREYVGKILFRNNPEFEKQFKEVRSKHPNRKWFEEYQGGGRVIPEITVYGKKKYLQELDEQQQKYLTDMAKYKQDSAQWAKANQSYLDSMSLYKAGEEYRDTAFDIYNPSEEEKQSWINDYHQQGLVPTTNKAIINYFMSPEFIEYEHSLTDLSRDAQKKGISPVKIYPRGEFELTAAPFFKQPVVQPVKPTVPTTVNLKYDPTYENLRMRPLWATMAKKDSTVKIGTLNQLDPLYEKGFTHQEAQKFPEEIRKQYKLDYPIYQDGGKVESREEYLKQQYQDYLKEEAQKGREVVIRGREKFAKDYLIPAIKTAGSFTPAGPIIGLADAYNAYQEGNTGWAVAGAAAEALPYVGRVVRKGLSTISKIGKYEILPTPKSNAYYRNIGGKEGYTDVLKRREIAPPIISIPETTGFRAIDGKISLPKKQFNRAFYAHKGKFSPALRYKGPYAVEAEVPMTNGFGGNWGFAPNPKTEGFINIPLDDSRVRILKQYRLPKTEKVLFQKELPKKEQGGIILKTQSGWLDKYK